MDNSADEAEIARLTGELETLMMRADITPAQVQTLRDQITALMATTPADVQALNEQITSLTEQLGTATADVTRLMGELQTAMDNSADEAEIARLMGELQTAMDNSADEAEIARLMGELGTAMDNSADVAEIARLTDLLDTANMRVTTLETQIGSMDDEADASETASLHAQLKAANAEVARIQIAAAAALEDAAMMERIAREAGIRMAIVANRVGAVAKLTPDLDTSGVSAVTATRDAADMVMIDVNGGDTDDVYAGGEVSAGSGAWTSAMLTKTDAASEAMDTLVIYTDIEEPADKRFTLQYSQEDRDDIFDVVARKKKARSSSFPSDPSTTWEYTGESGDRPKSFAGTFDGVAGQFECTAGVTCSIATDGKGVLDEIMGTWRFTPNNPNTATVKDPDVAYAYFGWWLNKPKANDGMHDVEVFAGGTDDHAVTTDNAIEGNASYTGPAAGKYVTKSFTAGVHKDSGVGHFTATASLVAKFGASTAAGTIGGTIGSFMLDGATTVPWSVKLEDANLNSPPVFDGTTEVNFGGGFTATVEGAGTWQGSFYADADTADDSNAPDTVAGTFDAVTENASVIGGFGATKQ